MFLTTFALATSSSAVWADRVGQRSDDRYDRHAPGYRHDRDRDRSRDHDRRVDRERERYQRYHDSRWYRDYHQRWVPLAVRYSARDRRQDIVLRGRGGRFDRIRIEAERGAPMVNQIAIEFVNGAKHVVQMRARLPAGAGEVIRLPGGDRRINRVIVYTEPRYGGMYSVYGT